jgi:hypothetical protein
MGVSPVLPEDCNSATTSLEDYIAMPFAMMENASSFLFTLLAILSSVLQGRRNGSHLFV